MGETVDFYKEQMVQMRVQRDKHDAIVAELKEQIIEANNKVIAANVEISELLKSRERHIASKKKPAVKRTRK